MTYSTNKIKNKLLKYIIENNKFPKCITKVFTNLKLHFIHNQWYDPFLHAVQYFKSNRGEHFHTTLQSYV